MPFHLAADKTRSLADAARMVPRGGLIALGGGLSARLPMALVRELIRQGIGDLHIIGSAHSMDMELLIAAGLVKVCEQSYVGFEQDHGLAPAFRRAAEEGLVEVRESCCDTILTQIRAAEMGLPFLPVRGVIATGIRDLHPEYGEVVCPFTGERLAAVPALRPDAVLVHAPLGDRAGNLHIDQPYVLDERLAAAGAQVVATVDRLAPAGEVAEAGIVIPAHYVAAVAECPWGAHPASCSPRYAYDRPHIAEWVRAASAGPQEADSYLEKYVTGTDESGYRRLIGRQRLERLARWNGSEQARMELFR